MINPTRRFFYNASRCALILTPNYSHTIFQTKQHVLAERRHGGTALLATDQKKTPQTASSIAGTDIGTFSPYGHAPDNRASTRWVAFNGEMPQINFRLYLLGNGYRAYLTALMRFSSPDSWSPFRSGGLNSYMYCGGDPVNKSDPSGHVPVTWKTVQKLFGRRRQPSQDIAGSAPATDQATSPPAYSRITGIAPPAYSNVSKLPNTSKLKPPPDYSTEPSKGIVVLEQRGNANVPVNSLIAYKKSAALALDQSARDGERRRAIAKWEKMENNRLPLQRDNRIIEAVTLGNLFDEQMMEMHNRAIRRSN